MSTRKLIVTAVICGFAILLAGGIQLLRISRTDDVAKVYSIGDSATVDGIAVTLTNFDTDTGGVRVLVPAAATALPAVASHFSMQRGGTRFDPLVRPNSEADCATKTAVPAQVLDCSLTFAPTGEGTSYVRFTANGKTAVWALP